MPLDDLLVRVDAQVAGFTGPMAGATRTTLQLEAALRRANTQQELYQSQLRKYGAESAQAQSALARAQMSNARLAEQQAAIQAKAAAEQRAALQAQATAYSRLGRTYVTVGGGIALALGASAKAAVDWEQSFTRVRQALDGSPEQIAQVESGLRDLARTLPVSHEALAEIARDASQLGIATPDIVSFTKVVGELSTTAPDLQDGATALARFLNVTGTSESQVENVASTMTKLGQAGASTVSEIADLGLRLAGAGRTASLTDGEILGLANAMTSLGLRVETAGTNFSKTLLTINTAVGEGGDKLKQFADIAGVSSQEFAKAYGDDAAQAILLFLRGLDRVRKSGGDVASTLGGLGITSQRQIDVLNRLSQSTDLVTESIETGNQAFSDNTALQETFGKQAETTASQMQVAANNVRDLGISIGETLLPALGNVAGGLADVSQALNGLPGPIKDIVVILGVAAAATTLFSGAQLLMKARLAEAQLALKDQPQLLARYGKAALAGRAGAVALGIGLATLAEHLDDVDTASKGAIDALSGAAIGFGTTGSPWGAAIGGAVGLLQAFAGKSAETEQRVQDLSATLDDQTAAITRNTAAWVSKRIVDTGAADDLAALGISTREFTDALFTGGSAADQFTAKLAAIVGGGTYAGAGGRVARVMNDQARAAQHLLDLFGDTGGELDAARTKTELYRDANRAATGSVKTFSDAGEVAAANVRAMGGAIEETHGPLTTQKADVDAAKAALAGYDSTALGIIDRQYALGAAIIAARKALKDQEDGFKRSTEAGQLNWQIIKGLATSVDGANAKFAQGRKEIEKSAAQIVEFAMAQGASEEQAKSYAEKLLGISDAAIDIKKNGDVVVHINADGDAKEELTAAQRLVRELDGSTVTITVRAINATAIGQQAAAAARSAGGGSWTGGYTGDGGKFEPAGIVHRGEFVFDKASTSRLGPDNLMAMMRAARGYASGGYAGGGSVWGGGEWPSGGGGNGGLLTLAELMRIIARPEAAMTLARVNALYRDRQQEERELQPLLEKQQRARENEKRAQQALNKLQRDDAATKKELADAQKNLNAYERETQRAEKGVADQRRDLADATQKWRDAQQQLIQDMRASVEQTLGFSSAFGGEGTSTSAQGLLAKKRAGAADTKEFLRDLKIIKRKGADKDLIAEIKAEGQSPDALALLRDLIRQPRSYFRAEARADAADRSSARSLAAFGVAGGGAGARIQTQIQKQGNVTIHKIEVADRAGWRREARQAVQQALALAGS